MNPLRCFVASAFDHEDVDAIYDRCIHPVLKSLKIVPLRVDRVEHNEDIDEKIIQLIETSDICIADLTYARPSVYFEAGHALGLGKPVIYVCRSDHFKGRDDDSQDNLRIHFDLQMKNIIPWRDPTQAFSLRLSRRLRHVLRPIEVKRLSALRLADERCEFERLSQWERRKLIAETATNLLCARGYSVQTVADNRIIDPSRILAAQTRSDVANLIYFWCLPTVEKKCLRELLDRGFYPFDMIDAALGTQCHYVLVSLRPIPRRRLDDALPSCTVDADGSRKFSRLSVRHSAERILRFYFIHNVHSVSEFGTQFRSLSCL